MPRRKIQRSPTEEEELFNRHLRERYAENERRQLVAVAHCSRRENVNSGGASSNLTAAQKQHNYRSRQKKNVTGSDLALDNEVSEHYIGNMNILCVHCGAKHFPAEQVANKRNSFNDCCKHGDVNLQPLPTMPTNLMSLFDASHKKSKKFFEHIRNYNSSFSFASFNANLVNFRFTRKAPFCFKIQGQIYYQINTALYPSNNEAPSYGQLFIVDNNEAVNFRLQRNSECDLEIMHLIENLMREHNMSARSYQMMYEELERQKSILANPVDEEPEMHLLFSLKPGMDRNRYNFQKVNEVAAVFSTTADGEIPESYVTVRNKSDKCLQYVSTMDPNVEPWIYPLFYPFGTQGWHRFLCTKKNKRVTRSEYIRYRIAIRNEMNVFLLGRRLFQQWLVDSYVKIEKDRIKFCKDNQKKLRAESYQGLIDYLAKRTQDNHQNVGKMVILPSSFQGSPRNMLQNYQDAMAIVRKFGKPDLFVTMTCNPKWREITENLLDGQIAADRPDIVTRVFNIKKDALVDLIVKQKFFGAVQAHVYVIEFQKRGLPHIHMLVTLKQSDKITTPEVIDRYISAEIPDPQEESRLHNIVLSNMIHGPCGNWCLTEQKKCSKHFPKKFIENTTLDEHGYPSYRRRNTGISFKRSDGYVCTNQYVVPHNPTLLKLFNCHINVEVVSSIKSVKYLYKYIYKGHDAARITIGESDETTIEHDEIRNFIETRYVGPVEAVWRILGKPLQNKSHSITRLPVHLPNQQNVVVSDDCDDNELRNALDKQTMLIDYFRLNSEDPEALQYLYGDIPSHYVFKKDYVSGKYHWQRRKKQFNVIGRMYAISPSQIELFHLRLLLIHVKGAKNFADLRTVNGVIEESFIAACLKLGLIEDDHEWKRALHEAEIWMMPKQLRCLFVRILIHCEPIHPEELWDEFKEAMSQDFERSCGKIEAQKKAYIQINSMLTAECRSLSMYPSMQQISDIECTEDILHEEQTLETGLRQYEHLNEKQKEIVDLILHRCDNENIFDNEPSCFYVDGPGGSGKTYMYTTLYSMLNNKGKNVCVMAFTGIAATLLPHGRTVHKTFGLPVPLFSDSSSNIKTNSKEANYLRSVDVFIWDEAPVAPKYALDIIDRTLRDLMSSAVLFGGKIMVLGGDFRQLLPVKVHGTRMETVSLSIKFSSLWSCFKKFSLVQNMRAAGEEREFSKFLLNIGDGSLNDFNDNVELPNRCIIDNDDIVKYVYGDIIKEKQFDRMIKCTILSARNNDVEEINKRVVELLDVTTEKLYTSVDSVENCDNGDINDAILPEYLNTLNPPNFPPHELKLRVNSIVMLIRNLSINEGLCNGTRLLILELGDNILRCKILAGDKQGGIVFINRITLYCENVYPFTFKRRQFPVKLAFAMTINKSQGQTFDNIGLDLRKDVFTHGQLYVALSRVRSWNGLKVYLGNQRSSNIVKNYVYKELYMEQY